MSFYTRQYLVKNKFAGAGQVAINGGSNGGLVHLFYSPYKILTPSPQAYLWPHVSIGRLKGLLAQQ